VADSAASIAQANALAQTLTVRPARSLWKDAWWQFRRHRLAMVALATLGFLVLSPSSARCSTTRGSTTSTSPFR